MKDFYVTLCHELAGYCIRAKAPDEKGLSIYLNRHYGGVWCRVCTESPTEKVIGQTLIISEYSA